MFISKIVINNYKLFEDFKLNSLNIPDGNNEGTGLNVFVGENGCGKTAILESLCLPILEYKTDTFSLDDMTDPEKEVHIRILANQSFEVKKTMPQGSFNAKGFEFKANIRARSNKSYLSTVVVSDQLFIREDPNKPQDGSPDLRLSVNNPFLGKRFTDNDIIFLDKNRLYQTRSGNFNSTRFDRVMEDFNYQYVKKSNEITDLNSILINEIGDNKTENKFLENAISTFKQITGKDIKLDLIDNYYPFTNANFVFKKTNNQQIKLNNLGSGYEMIFSLFYSFYLAQQSRKQLIILIDEPELHMHPALQEHLISFILTISKSAQIFISTHSPLLIKQLASNNAVKIMILKNDCEIATMDERKLPYISSNETNYLAFSLATEEYHNELYEELKYRYNEDISYKEFDNQFFIQKNNEIQSCPYKDKENQVSIHTYIRNQIHHSIENGKPDKEQLKESIKKMRTYF